jgi:hypothetical protein
LIPARAASSTSISKTGRTFRNETEKAAAWPPFCISVDKLLRKGCRRREQESAAAVYPPARACHPLLIVVPFAFYRLTPPGKYALYWEAEINRL